ncbi:hypothetical protein [Actinomycetospora callitridis]|uniref:hypothetical protein n=1 Tax=Actinomycetospora callitridis TaxID=913944 RepID=UPI002366821A|nr:hypothetical protein [Actinomycetospora callitridis]MDD7918922.1 hypothetical protein [Actinomycetospora callitridis]
MYAEQLNLLGRQGWEVVALAGPQNALVPSVPGGAAASASHVVETRFVLRRPAAGQDG